MKPRRQPLRGGKEVHVRGDESRVDVVVGFLSLDVPQSWLLESCQAEFSHIHDIEDLGASLASGSFRVDGMIVAPCSIKSLSAIAHSYSHNLLVRAADVTLKERRRLVLLVRETPLHEGHLELMVKVTRMGGIIMPPVPAFYHQPKTIEEVIDHTIGKVLDLFSIDHHLFTRWGTLPTEEI